VWLSPLRLGFMFLDQSGSDRTRAWSVLAPVMESFCWTG